MALKLISHNPNNTHGSGFWYTELCLLLEILSTHGSVKTQHNQNSTHGSLQKSIDQDYTHGSYL